MKKILLLSALLCFFVVNTVFAQHTIAIIDVQQVLVGSQAGKKAGAELKTETDAAIKKIQAKEAELKKLNDSIQKQKNSLSSEALTNKNLELNKKSIELERLQRDLQAELQQKEAAKLDAIAKELEPVLKDYAAEKKINAIFLKQAGVVFYDPQIDITKEIITRFDTKWSKKGK